jgi:hypothetical protein
VAERCQPERLKTNHFPKNQKYKLGVERMTDLSQDMDEQAALEAWIHSDNDAMAGRELPKTSQKQLLKTLRFLRDDLKYQNAQLPLPPTWVLKSVIRATHAPTYRPQKWHADLSKILVEIQSLIELEKEGTTQFYNEAMSKRLLPTIDQFSIDDLAAFVDEVRLHLNRIYS